MTLFRAIAFLLHFTIIPVAIGRLITYTKKNPAGKKPVVTYFVGWFSSLGIFYVLCSVLEWHQYWNTFDKPFTGSFSALCISYSFITMCMCLGWVKKDFAQIKLALSKLKNVPSWIGQILNRGVKDKIYKILYTAVFAVILGVQLYFAYGYQVGEWSYDDYDYVVNSQDTITTDTIAYVNYITGEMPFTADKRAVVAWPTYIAYLAKISGFEVATICHTIMPVILLLVAYFALYYMAMFLFKEFENRMIFMSLLAFTFMFGFYSHSSLTFRLLGTLWQGKAVLGAIALPFFMIYLFDEYRSDIKNTNAVQIALVSLGISSLSSMGLILLPCLDMSVWFVMCIYHRRIYGLRYLVASLFGVIYLYVFYILMSMLIQDMAGVTRIFHRGKDINWWYRWFGTNF